MGRGSRESSEQGCRKRIVLRTVVALAKYFYGSLVKLLVKYFCSILNILLCPTRALSVTYALPPPLSLFPLGMHQLCHYTHTYIYIYGANNEILIKPK